MAATAQGITHVGCLLCGSLEIQSRSCDNNTPLPARAISIYVQHARGEIERRDRKHYAVAASMLSEVKKLYAQLEDREGWTQLITALRAEFKQMPALQDEFNKARL